MSTFDPNDIADMPDPDPSNAVPVLPEAVVQPDEVRAEALGRALSQVVAGEFHNDPALIDQGVNAFKALPHTTARAVGDFALLGKIVASRYVVKMLDDLDES